MIGMNCMDCGNDIDYCTCRHNPIPGKFSPKPGPPAADRLAQMVTGEEGTYDCPICGTNHPHSHTDMILQVGRRDSPDDPIRWVDKCETAFREAQGRIAAGQWKGFLTRVLYLRARESAPALETKLKVGDEVTWVDVGRTYLGKVIAAERVTEYTVVPHGATRHYYGDDEVFRFAAAPRAGS